MAKANIAVNTAIKQKYIVGSICTFMHKGKLYTEGMEIKASVFSSESYFKALIKQGKIVPAPADEETSDIKAAESTVAETEKTEGTK